MITEVRITCLNCLYSKKLKPLPTDPKGTRIIISESCPKCNEEINGLRYYDENMIELTPAIAG